MEFRQFLACSYDPAPGPDGQGTLIDPSQKAIDPHQRWQYPSKMSQLSVYGA
jgi:hypothetical protein